MLTERPHKSRGISAPPRGAQRVRRVFVSVAPSELTSFERIKWALRNILTDVKRHNGIYPYSAGAPKIADVLKRAGLSERFLEKQGGNLLREKQKALSAITKCGVIRRGYSVISWPGASQPSGSGRALRLPASGSCCLASPHGRAQPWHHQAPHRE